MKPFAFPAVAACALFTPLLFSTAFALSEEEAIQKLEAGGARLKVEEGHARGVSFPKKGGDELVELLAYLPEVETVGAQHSEAGSKAWQAVQKLPKLRSLVVWDSHRIDDLRVFQNLPVENLMLGGTMGLKKGDRSEKAILDLGGYPNLRKLALAHSPNIQSDEETLHLVKQIPTVETLRIDFGKSEGRTVSIESAKAVASLPELRSLEVEGAAIPPEFLEIFASAPKLQKLIVRLGKPGNPSRLISDEQLEAFRKKHPGIELKTDA